MPDTINEGFGTSAPTTLATATNDLLVRYIQAPPDNFIRIRVIAPAVVQMTGAIAATTVIPIFVLRGTGSLGISAALGNQLVAPLRPGGVNMPGLPDIAQLAGGIELLLATYINSRTGAPLFFPDDDSRPADLVARDTQKLAVCVGPLIDVSVSPAVQVAAATFGATLSILGSQGKLDNDTKLPGQLGESKSLQRYEICIDEAIDSRVHPSSK